MKFSRLQLTNFTVFEDATFEFCPGINVLIGANGTGKSHVLKVAYAIQNCWNVVNRSFKNLLVPPDPGHTTWQRFLPSLDTELEAVFHIAPGGLMRDEVLVHGFDNLGDEDPPLPGMRTFILSANDLSSFRLRFTDFGFDESPCAYIPPREFLAAYEGFIAAYEKRESAFDRTYFDLCVQLSASRLRGKALEWGKHVAEKLESVLSGRVELKDGKFYVGSLPVHVVAEGHRKFAMLVQLLRNGGISPGMTLYWDEPESGLNPKLVKVIADVLLLLAEQGVQIVLATHDFLLTQELSLAVEYQTTSAPVRFFCLTRDDSYSHVHVQVGDTLAHIDHNPIVEEFSALHDRELDLFSQTPPRSAGGAAL